LNEIILLKDETHALSAATNTERFPFAILANKTNPKMTLFGSAHRDISPEQPVRFQWRGGVSELRITRIRPSIEILSAEFVPLRKHDTLKPFLLFAQDDPFTVKCSIFNHAKESVGGYLEAFLSHIGEPQPWKDYEAASDTQEFFLESNQGITIEMAFGTDKLSGDHELSLWVFTREDLPFSPQNGVLFSKQIRVDSPRLGIHPIYEVQIP